MGIGALRSADGLGVVSPNGTAGLTGVVSRVGLLGPGSGGNDNGIDRGLTSSEAAALGSHIPCSRDTALARSIAGGAEAPWSPATTDDALDGIDRELLAPEDSPLPGAGLSWPSDCRPEPMSARRTESSGR